MNLGEELIIIRSQLQPQLMASHRSYTNQKPIDYERLTSFLKRDDSFFTSWGQFSPKDQAKASDPIDQKEEISGNYKNSGSMEFDSESLFSYNIRDILGKRIKYPQKEESLPKTKYKDCNESATILPEHLTSLVVSVLDDDNSSNQCSTEMESDS